MILLREGKEINYVTLIGCRVTLRTSEGCTTIQINKWTGSIKPIECPC